MSNKLGCSPAYIHKRMVDRNCSNNLEKLKQVNERIKTVSPFKDLDEYLDYIQEQRIYKIPRFLEFDALFNVFMGLMYGDGWNRPVEHVLGVALNTTNHKDLVNRNIFKKMVERIGLPLYENKSKTKNLAQLSFMSYIMSEFFSRMFFSSKKGKTKEFNPELFNQSKKNLKALRVGLFLSDGHKPKDPKNRKCFDNTSPSIINAYRILSMSTLKEGVLPISIRQAYISDGKYPCVKSYKAKHPLNPYNNFRTTDRIIDDEKYWYLPVKKIVNIPKKESVVYDLTVENSHSYMINNMVVHNSSVSFYINTLLGFSKVDRITAKVKMFPSRFMSKSRILETKSLPDLDLNLSAQEPFYAAQKELLGEYNSYPMIAYGTFKKKSAFKMYAKVSDIDFSTSNAVAQQIEQYEKAMAHADDDEKDMILLEDYIDKKYWELYKNSEVYQGIISSLSPHPCAYLIYDKDIREEIGLIRVKSESTKKNVMACLMDGRSAERYKFLKNDLLKVDVVDFLHKIADKTGISLMSEKDLILSTIHDKKTWKIYENGYTLGVNQVEKENTRQKVMRYKPQSIEELCAFIAAIRPSFSSMYNIFESREHFEYGIPSFDKLIQSTGLDSSFMLYQETIMAVLSFAGFPEDETYSIIKWISKKQEEKIKQIKPRFVKNLVKIFIDNDGMTEKSAKESCEKVWKIIEDSSRYGFNASHSYSYAYDSLMSAYYKAHYPLEFYDVLLQEYTKKGNKNKVALLKVEMQEGFDIGLNPIKFGYDNRNFSIDYENRKMNQSIVSWKTFSATSAKELYKLGKGSYNNFFEVWKAFKESAIGDTMFNALIRMNYFEDYGKTQKLLDLTDIYEKFGNAKQLKKENLSTKEYQIVEKYSAETEKMFKELDNEAIISELSSDVENKEIPLSKKMDAELEFLGYIQTTSKKVKPSYAYVTSIERKYKHPVIELYRINDGSTETIKININEFNAQPFKVGSILETYEYKEQGKWKKNGTEWTQDWTQKEKFLIRYRIVKE